MQYPSDELRALALSHVEHGSKMRGILLRSSQLVNRDVMTPEQREAWEDEHSLLMWRFEALRNQDWVLYLELGGDDTEAVCRLANYQEGHTL